MAKGSKTLPEGIRRKEAVKRVKESKTQRKVYFETLVDGKIRRVASPWRVGKK